MKSKDRLSVTTFQGNLEPVNQNISELAEYLSPSPLVKSKKSFDRFNIYDVLMSPGEGQTRYS
jgi:hypothetical protein